MVLMENHQWLLAPWHCLGQCVKEEGIAFNKAHGSEIWDFASKNPEFNNIFNKGMACTAKIVTRGTTKNWVFSNVSTVHHFCHVSNY